MLRLLVLLQVLISIIALPNHNNGNVSGSSFNSTRELSYLDRHEELLPLYMKGDPRVRRRLITHKPTRKQPHRSPSKRQQPHRSPSKRQQPHRCHHQ